ncbi:CBN-NEP-1 protein [Aphelenchoides avenae]|nr:CBN-NEP-1 protein [Aphelenchus avenae]
MTGAELQPRWKICTATVLEGLPQAAGALYVRHHFNETSQARVVGVVKNILETFRAMIVESEWLDPRTKRHALQKVDALEITIGFTRMHFEDSELDKYHDGINITRRDTFATMKAKLANFAMLKSIQRLLGPGDRTEFHVSPAEANGYYDPTKNAMFLLAASLQPYVEDDLPSFYAYATLGAYVGHESRTHSTTQVSGGVSVFGIHYDKVGHLENWWSNASFTRFTYRTQCIVDEYSKFVVDEIGMNLNGRLTLGENIADNVALKASFRAFSALNRHSIIAPTGLEGSTPQQSFFLSYGYSWCSSMRPDAARRQILTDTHSPEKFRVNGVVVNSPEFADAFGCPLGTPMNPRNKCTLW